VKGRKGGGCNWRSVLAVAAAGVAGPAPLGPDGSEMVGLGASCAWQLELRQCSCCPPRRQLRSDTTLVVGLGAVRCVLVVPWWCFELGRASPAEVLWRRWGADYCHG
jgi:hypothetical protein